MIASLGPAWSWVWSGLREAASMLWLTFWPLVLGFSLSGVVQGMLGRDALRRRLGDTTAASVARASVLGTISSSCSYAASAMARALFARGASLPNALVFMVASTNLVVELGVVLVVLLGWPFLGAQLVGGVVMVALLAPLTMWAFPAARQESLRALQGTEAAEAATAAPWRERIRDRANWRRSARYTRGDFTMLRRELAIGFVVAGFLAAHVPNAWWRDLFVTGHGGWTTLENVAVAPLLAVVSFVCSVGNIPLAAALWVRGVSFGGVIAFVFADLVTLPLLLVYRRLYGAAAARRIAVVLYGAIVLAGLGVAGLFAAAHWVPAARSAQERLGEFPLGATLALNAVALVVLALVLVAARGHDEATAIDPVCGMAVDRSAPGATLREGGVTYYFCSPRCAERFAARAEAAPATEEDPVCHMGVDPATALAWVDEGGRAWHFCSEGCRERFAAERAAAPVAEDPVCHMSVDPRTAVSWTDPDGATWHFCCEGCQESFAASRGAAR